MAMDAFTRRVELAEEDDVAMVTQHPQLPSSDVAAPGAEDDSGGQVVSDEEQVVPGEEDHSETATPRRRTFYEAPEFVERLNVFEEVEEGGGLSFECQVRAFPRPIVKWFKDDVEMSSDDGRVFAEEWPTNTSNCSFLRLVIHDARKDDEGAYRCKAENEEGVAATTGYLSVTGSSTSSARVNAVSSPPLLRAITEQQSMEEREAAEYQLRAPVSASGDDYQYDRMSPTNGDAISSQVGWTYVDYMKAAGLDPGEPLKDTESGSDTSVEAEVDFDRVVVGKHASTSSKPAGHGPDNTATGDQGDVGSVNVFVVESRHVDATTDDQSPSRSDMKPLLIAGRHQPPETRPEPVSAVQGPVRHEISGDLLLPFQVDGVSAFPGPAPVDSGGDAFRPVEVGTAGRGHVEQSKPETDEVFLTEEPARTLDVAGGLRHRGPAEKPAAVSDGPRPVVELSCSALMDFYVSWFDPPWVVYLLVVVGSTLLASATDLDPAAHILIVLIASALCFGFCPPTPDCLDETPAVKNSQ